MSQYGKFDNAHREYVITDPRTPFPWINYLGTDKFFSIISNTAGGYSFYQDAKLRRITRYRYNNVPADMGGRYFYINDGSSVWSPTWKPTQVDLEAYECRHGLGYTAITGQYHGIEAECTFFVPLHDNCEIHKLVIRNKSSEHKSIKLYSFIEFALWNAWDDQTNFQRNLNTGEVEVADSAIYHKTEYKERRNHYAFYSVNCPMNGFDTDRSTFLGKYNGFDTPQAAIEGTSFGSIAHGWSPIASHRIDIDFLPDEEKEFIFILGYVENTPDEKWESKGIINKEKALAIQSKYHSAQSVDNALSELKAYWDMLLSSFQIQSADDRLDTMVNIWNQYQCMVTFFMSRSASLFESGIGRGMGFRDSNQDLIGCMHMISSRARRRILDIAATQMPDGSVWHQYQPLTKRGNSDIGGGFNDDPLWLIFAVSQYIKETGDFSILQEQVEYNNDGNAQSLFLHLKRSFRHTVDKRGPHGLPLIGRADWNDCLNLNCFSTNPDESYQTTENKTGGVAESLMIAGMFVLYGTEYAKICHLTGNDDESTKAQACIDEMKEAVAKYGWDGEWFLRAYDYYGKPVGTHLDAEGKIFIESQGYCVMAGLGINDGRARKALDSVKKHLDCKYGLVLNYPAFTTYRLNLGEISTYPIGYKENGGIFCHNNPWIIISETKLHNAAQAFEYYKKITPTYLQDIQELHCTEPYVYSQMIAGKEAFRPGEAKNSWLTGTAAWSFYAISQFILGIRPDYKGIYIDPCIPDDLGNITIKRIFRGRELSIRIKQHTGHQLLSVNGERMEGCFIPVDKITPACEILCLLK